MKSKDTEEWRDEALDQLADKLMPKDYAIRNDRISANDPEWDEELPPVIFWIGWLAVIIGFLALFYSFRG